MTNLFKNKRLYPLFIILLFITSLLMSACGKQPVYYAFQSLPQDGWMRQDTLHFKAVVPDSQTHYKLFIEVRNRNTYPYQNLNLSICYNSPAPQRRLPADSLTLILVEKEGTWKGSGWGGLYQLSFSAGDIKIEKPGDYLFKIAHTLPDQLLPGINDIGIRLER